MKTLTKANEIWCLTPNKKDLKVGAEYAAITLPWTFNRMMLNTKSSGQQMRAINIVKGIVCQEVLKKKLESLGIPVEVQRKSYRDEDLFDFKIKLDGELTKLDLKSFHYFTNYPGDVRKPLSAELVVENRSYYGPDWRRFLPMLVPHTQIKQGKEAYCFAIASSIDVRKNALEGRSSFALTAFPYGEHLAFLGARNLCLQREENKKGYYLSCSYLGGDELFDSSNIIVTFNGEWDGKTQVIEHVFSPGEMIDNIGPFSCVASVQIDKDGYDGLNGKLSIEISKNDFKKVVYNTAKKNVNTVPKEPLIFQKSDFCNLVLPDDFKVYFLGWITKDEFLEHCKKYTGWVWPNDKKNKFENQPWSQITENDVKLLNSKGFGDSIQKKPSMVNAGWLKTSGMGTGTACYVFPNTFGGGLKETNLYVLPQDLYTMDNIIDKRK